MTEFEIDKEGLTLKLKNMMHVNDGDVARKYNGLLQTVFKVDNPKKEFTIDAKGLSPELESEIGDYLTIKNVNPYVVIVSSDQAAAPVMDPLFSFDKEFMDFLYKKAGNAINLITANEVLWGEMENGLDLITGIDDLLRIEKVSLRLDTSLGSVQNIKTLQDMHQNLKGYLDNDSKIRTMMDMHRKLNLLGYGDVRNIRINGTFPVEMKVDSFYTKLFCGTYVLKERKKALIVHNLEKEAESSGDIIKINMNDPRLIDFLFENNFIGYERRKEAIEKIMIDLEDAVLLNQGFAIFGERKGEISEHAYLLNRKKGLLRYAKSLPSTWYELGEIMNAYNRTSRVNIENMIIGSSHDVKALLGVPKKDTNIVGRLLFDMQTFSSDYRKMAEIDPYSVVKEFNNSSNSKKKFIIYKLSMEG